MTKWSHAFPVNAPGTTPFRTFKGNVILFVFLLAGLQLYFIGGSFPTLFHRTEQLPIHAERSLARCASLKVSAGPPAHFHDRTESDRFVLGTKATLLHNARIWTGENNGTEILHGDVFIDKGIIQGVGIVNLSALRFDLDSMVARGELNVVDVHGAWVTPGCVYPCPGVRLLSTTVELILSIFPTASLTHILTLVMRPHLHSTVHRVMTTLSREPFNHGFVRWMDLIHMTTLIPCQLPAVSQLP
jgi:hypothetical protein